MQRSSVLAAGLVLVAACHDSTAPALAPTPATSPPVFPSVGAVTVGADSTDALAALITFAAHAADSARVLYRVNGGPQQATALLPVGDSSQVALLDLPAGSTVTARVVVVAAGRADTSAATTGTLGGVPDVVRRVQLQTTAGTPATGYVLTAVMLGDTAYAVAFDTAGHVAWYRAFPGETGVADAYQQPDGNISLFLGSSRGWDPFPDGHFVEVRSTGDTARTWHAPSGFYTDPHEIRVAADDTYAYLFGYDRRPTDLTSRGGAIDSVVAAHTIFRVTAAGVATPVFAVRDHFTVADWVMPPSGIGDLDHPNSLDVDRDGGLVVSWRNIGEVSKIDPSTGAFLWRLGGPHNEFTFIGDPLNGFGGQHFARVLPNGDLLLYDNGWTHAPNETRVVEYRLDVAARTATLVWEFRRQPTLFTPFVGSVQRLVSGATFVGYANAGIATEVDPSGSVRWEGRLVVDGVVYVNAYRILKIASLAEYARP